METATQEAPEIAAQLDAARAVLADYGADPAALELGAEAAHTVAVLTRDPDLAVGTLLHRAQLAGLSREIRQLESRLGANPLRLASELQRLGELRLPDGWSAAQGLTASQAEILRKMLLAVAADPRLVVARLAEQLIQLRHARKLPPDEQRRLASETREVLAPLANRLGVWNLKWELEDLAFRYLEPEDYHRIARALAERRVDRERYIVEVCAQLRRELELAGLSAAAVYGRPKHIYSIARKMQRKHIAFEQLYDVRAVRIVVESIAACYAALGVVHGLWHYIPGEFDDYIATPKDNEYRSIHTAVTGPEGKSLEVQIRSQDMHEYAELGVAAHWRYKEGGARDLDYERKIEWVRRVLDPGQQMQNEGDLIERVKGELFADRIYAMTPRGEVVDLPRGATPLDFAYHVHSDLGHRCRGAKVDGRIVPLNQPLTNGGVVEIITGKQAAPSRDWLSPDQGYLASSRSRAKVRAWFRRIDQSEKQRLLGAGEIGSVALSQAPTRVRTSDPPAVPPPRKRPKRASSRSPVEIEGVGDLPTTIARCCAPVPPEPIAGYVTLGRGVTIHRADCPNLLRMRAQNTTRMLNVEWSLDSDSLLPVQIRVEALDRRGLLRDVTDVMALEKLSIDGVNSDTDPDDRVATIVMRTAVRDIDQLARVLQRLTGVPNVLRAQRMA
jgi:GTP pyrophosphokinase